MSDNVIVAQSTAAIEVDATSSEVETMLWFKTSPLDRNFCYRATQLQLWTDSHDQGPASDASQGAWTWFEVCILENEYAQQPLVKDDKTLTWKSHFNRLNSDGSIARHFGDIFDRRQGILNEIEIGNCIGVLVCAQYACWRNHATRGTLTANVLAHDLFSPMSWTLGSFSTPFIPEEIENGLYTLTAPHDCHVVAEDAELHSKMWFTTPAFDEDILDRVQDVRLYTVAHHQGFIDYPEDGMWSWFDIVILDTPNSKRPKIKNGRELVWISHQVSAEHSEYAKVDGKLFTRDDSLLNFLEPGNAIGVRVCARFAAWENHAKDGRLVVRIFNGGNWRTTQENTPVDWDDVVQSNRNLQARLRTTLPSDATSLETDLLTQPLRHDEDYGAGGAPLRLLCLDGGGVRGLSALHILKALFNGDENARPCEYFDMMAGTSTGGLIAIMLGRLRMTIKDCIDAYEGLSSNIFGIGMLAKAANSMNLGSRYNSDKLEDAIKRIVEKYSESKDPEEKMRDARDGCKVFVLTVDSQNLNNKKATHMRTYDNPKVYPSFADYKIWEAARATSAAPTYFPRIKLGDYEYIDGGVGYNNPVLLLMGEARLYYGFARPVGCLVTLGTGMVPNIAFPEEGTGLWSNAVGTAKIACDIMALATTSERANLEAEPLCEGGTYYRFNMGKYKAERRWYEKVYPPSTSWWQKLFTTKIDKEFFHQADWEDIDIDLNDHEKLGEIVALTKEYLGYEDPRVEDCSTKLQLGTPVFECVDPFTIVVA